MLIRCVVFRAGKNIRETSASQLNAVVIELLFIGSNNGIIQRRDRLSLASDFVVIPW